MCTCCSDLPIVRQPVLIYPFIPLNYVFSPPPNWQPKVMPAMNFPIPGIAPNPMNVGMNVSMNPNPMNVNVNMSSNPMNEPTGMNMNVQMNVNMQPL